MNWYKQTQRFVQDKEYERITDESDKPGYMQIGHNAYLKTNPHIQGGGIDWESKG